MIDAEKANYPITFMCQLRGVPRSSFYAWRNRIESASSTRRRLLGEQISRVFAEHRGRYGCRRVAAHLNREGHECSVGLVADLMREMALTACQPRAYQRTTLPGGQPVYSPDLLEGDFSSTEPGQRLVGDIRYLRTDQGWLYLANGDRSGHPHGDRLAAGRAPAHQPGYRRPGHGHYPRPRSTRSDFP